MELADSQSRDRKIVAAVLTTGLTGLALLMLATWVPHYLTWPWWPDLDTYATMALGWDQGIRPYRDVLIFNFPGQIYLFWLLGKLFGWGRTVPIYAVDAALLVGLGLALVAWSRRRLGGVLPGLLGFVAFLGYYLSLDISLVAQRDWHGPLFAVLGLLAAQGVRGTGGLVLSALAFAVGAVFRPHILLFVPAMALALDESARAPDGPAIRTVRVWLLWGLLVAVFLVVGFLPLIASGLLDDMIRGLRVARFGGSYGGQSLVLSALTLLEQLQDRKYLLEALALLVLMHRAAPAERRLALPWLVALGFSLIYKPLHPLPHSYLAHPLNLMWAVALAPLARLVQLELRERPVSSALATVMLLLIAIGGVPTYCSVSASLRAIQSLSRREMPAEVPRGATTYFDRTSNAKQPYGWDDYRNLLAYLREKTGPETLVANALKAPQYLAVNGTVGRPSPWPTEAGMPYLRLVDLSKNAEFARSLNVGADTVVVWAPGEKDLETPILDQAIRDSFAPEAKFGVIEVWRRRPDAGKLDGGSRRPIP